MERINTLKRAEILRELQTYKKYQGKTQKHISDKYNNITKLRSELYTLQAGNKFHHYEELPDELQNVILQESKTLKYYPRLSKKSNTTTDLSYFNEYCDLPIHDKEIKSYVETTKPKTLIIYRQE